MDIKQDGWINRDVSKWRKYEWRAKMSKWGDGKREKRNSNKQSSKCNATGRRQLGGEIK